VSGLWRATLREARNRPGRTALSLVGIVIGVAAPVGIGLTSGVTRRAYVEMFEAAAGPASLEIVSEGFSGFDPAAATAEAARVPGVRETRRAVQAPAALDGVPVLALGLEAFDGLTLRHGALPGAEGGALLPQSLADARSLSVGGGFRLLTPSGAAPLTLAGTLAPRGAARFGGGAVVVLGLETAQRLFGLRDGRVHSLQLRLDAGADPVAVTAALEGRLPPGLYVQPPASRGLLAEESLAASERGLAAVSLISLVAGAFIILNSFQMALSERRRALALLRALGATRGQVLRALVSEALALGALGGALGAALGIGLSWVIARGMERLLGIELPAVPLAAGPVVLAGLLGPLTALLATAFPARQAAGRRPLDGLRDQRGPEEEPGGRWPRRVGLVCLLAVLLCEIGFLAGVLSAAMIAPVMVLLLVGCVLSLPWVLDPLAALVRALLRRFLGRIGEIAVRQLLRHRTRTSLTAGVLLLAVTVGIGMGHALLSHVGDIHDWYDRTFDGDWYVRGAMPDAGTTSAVALSAELGERIAGLSGVARVDRVRFQPARVAGRAVIVIGRTFDQAAPLPMDLVEGRPGEALRGLLRGEVALGTTLAHRLGIGVGGHIELATASGPRPFQVAAVVTEYTGSGFALYADWETVRRAFAVDGAHAFIVSERSGAAASPEAELRRLAAAEGLLLQSNREVRAAIDRMLSGVVGLLWALLALVFVVASLGVANTLVMNLLEQRRELALLRAVALRRRDVRALVLAQGLALALVGAVPGVFVGTALGWLMTLTMRPFLGVPLEFRLDPALVAGTFALALGIAVLVAGFPAVRAARADPRESLLFE
jgi:putative ABC transport system permease protein